MQLISAAENCPLSVANRCWPRGWAAWASISFAMICHAQDGRHEAHLVAAGPTDLQRFSEILPAARTDSLEVWARRKHQTVAAPLARRPAVTGRRHRYLGHRKPINPRRGRHVEPFGGADPGDHVHEAVRKLGGRAGADGAKVEPTVADGGEVAVTAV